MEEKKPTPVKIIETEKAIPVIIEDEKKEKKKVYVDKHFKKALAPDTTEQEDITKAGQRRVNLIWEFTQAIIAIMITAAVVYMKINSIQSDGTLANAFFLIVSMYFIRTNHNLVGGVGPKPKNETR